MNNVLNKFNKKFIAFSLIELMIALAILAIITTIAITQYNIYIKKVALATATSLTDNIKARVMSYYADQEQFPSVANGNATEINNTFNIKALDANSKQYISNVQLYSRTDTNYPQLPISIWSTFNNPNSISGYVKIDFNPEKKLSLDPGYPAQLFLVAFEISNSTAYLNNYDASQISSKPQLVLVSDATLGSQIAWQLYQSNININFPGATKACPGEQVMIGSNCSLCGGVLAISGTTLICDSCPIHATCSKGSITGCQSGYYGTNCNSSISACNGIISGTSTSATCTSCPTNATCSAGTINGCASGYYGANCSFSISTCNGVISGSGPSATCISCSTYAHAICNGGTIIGCDPGYYYNGVNCAACSGNCKVCTDNTHCTTCATGYYLYNDASTASCPSGMYIFNNTCVSGCPAGYYGNPCTLCSGYITGTGSSQICNPCPVNAQSCADGKIVVCNPGYYGVCGDNNRIIDCPGYVNDNFGSGTGYCVNTCPGDHATCANGVITNCFNRWVYKSGPVGNGDTWSGCVYRP